MKEFEPARMTAINASFGPMVWACAPNSSVANAQRFCKTGS